MLAFSVHNTAEAMILSNLEWHDRDEGMEQMGGLYCNTRVKMHNQKAACGQKAPPSKLSVSASTRDAVLPVMFRNFLSFAQLARKVKKREKKKSFKLLRKEQRKTQLLTSPHTRRQTKQLIGLSFKLGDAAAEWQPAWDQWHRTGNAALCELRGGGGGLWLWMHLHAPYCMYFKKNIK